MMQYVICRKKKEFLKYIDIKILIQFCTQQLLSIVNLEWDNVKITLFNIMRNMIRNIALPCIPVYISLLTLY